MSKEECWDTRLITHAAQLKVRNRLDFESEDEYTDFVIEPNCDPKLGRGVWVQVWMFLSKSEIESAGDMTP